MDSAMLTSTQKTELMKVCEFDPKSKCTLLYRGSRDGFRANIFHSKCDGRLKTLTLVKSTNGNLFGGYTAVAWDKSNSWKNDSNAFLFSLVNKDNQPIKLKFNGDGDAIYCGVIWSGVFGDDLCIASDANTNKKSYSDLGDRYPHPKYTKESVEAKSFLAGSYNFQIAEIEVFHLL